MFELVVDLNGRVDVVFCDEDKRVVELVRQRHARSLAPGEATIREAKK